MIVTAAIYAVATLAAMALMLGLAFLLFGDGAARLDGGSVARQLAIETPRVQPAEILISQDGSAAVARAANDGALYLVVVLGRKLVTRRLRRGMIQDLAQSGAALAFRQPDVTLPRVKMTFADADDAVRAFAVLHTLVSSGHASD